jgi:cytochrome P450
MGFHWNFSLMPYGERWRQRRKMLHAHVQSSVVSQYQPIQIRAARELAHELLTVLPSPETLPALVRAHVGAEIVKVTYGIEVGKSEAARQKYIDVAEQAVAGFVKGASPGHFMVDYFPFCTCLFRSW